MTITDKILNEWSFRCHDGIVDMNDPTKREILNTILKENGLNEMEIDEANNVTYDDIIKNVLVKASIITKDENIPQVKNNYNLGDSTNVNGDDAEIFKMLYSVAPPKKDQDIDSAGSKGSGHGEIALYWLFAYQNPPKNVTGNPGRGKADLNIGGEGVEVKAYDSKNMAFGRIGSDKENLELLNTLFGLYSLDSIVSDKEKKDSNKQPNSLRFSKQDIINAFKIAQKFNEDTKLKDLSAEYPLIYNIYARLSNLVKKLPENTNINDAEDAAGALMKNILLRKSLEKIGSKGYIVNVSPNGNLEYFKIDQTSIEAISNKVVLENTSINQGMIIVNPEKLFI
jgi:hypothetical protein